MKTEVMSNELHVLLIDDNDVDIIVNSKLIKLAGITNRIVPFTNGEDFIEHIRQNPDVIHSGNTVVLMDIQMPMMDGFKCLEVFTSEFPELSDLCSIYLLSSSIDKRDIQRAEQIDYIIRVLEKPLDVYSLRRHIEEGII